jgi:hypothetical protein
MAKSMLNLRRGSALLIALTSILSALYFGSILRRGWDPEDDGTLGQSAERVLRNELPHRDFHDPYTGGQAFLNAAVFKVFGVNLFALRVVLFVVYLAWVPAVFSIAREFLAPWPSVGATLVAVAWSVPNFTTPMPSWFNMFFATFGVLALAKYIRNPSVRWLILGGLCGGISFLFKSVALYYIAGAILFFVYREQDLSRGAPGTLRRTPGYLAFLVACLGIFLVALLRLIGAIATSTHYFHFFLPALAVTTLLIWRERSDSALSGWLRFKSLVVMVAPFLAAAAMPILLFALYYARQHAMASLRDGLFAAPFRRLLSASLDPAELVFEYPSVLCVLLILENAKLRGKQRLVLSLFLAMAAAAVLLTSHILDLSYLVAVQSACGLIPILVVAAVLVLGREPGAHPESNNNHYLALLLTVTSTFSLIQFPYSALGYFYYVAPLAVLLTASLLSRLPRPPRLILYTAVTFYILFGIFDLRDGYIGTLYHPEPRYTKLAIPQAGGLLVSDKSNADFSELITFVRGVAGSGSIYAGPDCPEVYFLSGITNQTPILFDSLEDQNRYRLEMNDLIASPTSILKVVVLRDLPNNSVEQLSLLRSLVIPRFPNSRRIGNFTVYWRS